MRSHKPVKGILMGLLFTILIPICISIILVLILGIALSVDIDSVDATVDNLISSHIFLIPSILFSAYFSYLGGRAVAKRTPRSELTFGIILAAITTLIAASMYLIPDESSATSPWYYDVISFLIIIVLIPYGALSMRGKSKTTAAN